MSVKSVSKKGAIAFYHGHGGRPSDFGTRQSGGNYAGPSLVTSVKIRKIIAMQSKATRLAVAKEILAFRGNGWGKLSAQEKATRSSIVQALFRRGVVTAIKSRQIALEVLESLACRGKIRLPPKTNHGGPNHMKTKK